MSRVTSLNMSKLLVFWFGSQWFIGYVCANLNTGHVRYSCLSMNLILLVPFAVYFNCSLLRTITAQKNRFRVNIRWMVDRRFIGAFVSSVCFNYVFFIFILPLHPLSSLNTRLSRFEYKRFSLTQLRSTQIECWKYIWRVFTNSCASQLCSLLSMSIFISLAFPLITYYHTHSLWI